MPPTAPAYRAAFPKLTDDNHRQSSQYDPRYNCIGYAAGTKMWWQALPLIGGKRYWPPGVPQQETIDAYVKAYEFKGYSVCPDGSYEQGYEKVAIFALNGVPKHAALQLDEYCWTSKLGKAEDIHHQLLDLEGAQYGNVVRYLKRTKTIAPSAP
ncbi:MAG: DUF7689 domain-containing protein [Xanthobacteraceae bacterium]